MGIFTESLLESANSVVELAVSTDSTDGSSPDLTRYGPLFYPTRATIILRLNLVTIAR